MRSHCYERQALTFRLRLSNHRHVETLRTDSFALLGLALLFAVVAAVVIPCAGAQSRSEEYHVKAGFLFHFAQLVDWPPEASVGPSFNLCTVGDDPFHGDLENTLESKPIGNRSIRVLHLRQPAEPSSDCRILFISTSEEQHLTAIFAQLGNAPVMTVGETDDFIDKGGMIRFCLEDNRVRFEISLKAAERAKLKFSSRLLLLAKNVFGRTQE